VNSGGFLLGIFGGQLYCLKIYFIMKKVNMNEYSFNRKRDIQ